MRHIKRLLIILLVLFCCCSKSISDEKRYRTATAVYGLDIYTNPEKTYVGQEIGTIPFKGRVEIVDNNEIKVDDRSFIKIKYKDIIGYVRSSFLSERSDIPFVDNVKYDYTLNEFEYNREMVIDLTKKAMIEYGEYRAVPLSSYYIDDPQIFSFYGKDCSGRDTDYILVIVVSKLYKASNCNLTYIKKSENEYTIIGYGSGFDADEDELKHYIKLIREEGGECP